MIKKMTLEELARMTANGFAAMEKHFDQTASKSDLDELATKKDLADVKEELQTDIKRIGNVPLGLERRLDRVEDDLRLVKTKVGIR